MLPQEILTLAQQGHPIAIGTLLNYSIRSQGIKARVQRQDQRLHVLLESQQAIDPEKAIAFVKGSVSVLNVDSIQIIMVYSRRQGKMHLDWWQTIELHSSAEPSSASLPLFNWVNLPLSPASLPDLSLSNPPELPLSRRDAVTQDNVFSESLEPAHAAAIESSTRSLIDKQIDKQIEKQVEEQVEKQVEEQAVPSVQQAVSLGRSSEELPVEFNAASVESPFPSPDVPSQTPEVFKRPESVIFLLFISLFIFWDAYVEFLDDGFSPETTAISASQLARRLKISRKVIRRRKRDRDFPAWTRSLDPDGIAWTYRKGYYLSQP